LGRRLVRDFVARGHTVVGLSRSPEGADEIRRRGGTAAHADVFDAAALAGAAAGCEVVIRAATSIPQKAKARLADFEMNNRLRTEGTKALLQAARAIKAKTFLQESIVWVARPPDGSPFDEDSPPQRGPLNDATLEGERLAAEAAAQGPLVATTLRLGNFYGPDAFHTRFMGERLAKHKLPVIGQGTSVLSLVHVDDAASAFVAAAEAPVSGLFHVTDDAPAPVGDFLTTFAQHIGARPPGHVPPWLARLVAGKLVTEWFTTSMQTSNSRFNSAFQWKPRHPSYREGLDQVAAVWKQEGFIVKGAQ
jgi:nucleoside-diphosphate-sugar epimerase